MQGWAFWTVASPAGHAPATPPSWFHGDFLAFGVEFCSQMVFHILMTSACLFWSGSAMLFPAWHGISLCFSGIRCQRSCPESLCPESLFPHRLSSHTCFFSSSPSSSPRPSLSFFVMLFHFKSSLGLEAEAKVVIGGRERIYSFNYRDSLENNKNNNKKREYLSL